MVELAPGCSHSPTDRILFTNPLRICTTASSGPVSGEHPRRPAPLGQRDEKRSVSTLKIKDALLSERPECQLAVVPDEAFTR